VVHDCQLKLREVGQIKRDIREVDLFAGCVGLESLDQPRYRFRRTIGSNRSSPDSDQRRLG
jgi:hypothetical protein